MTYKVCGTLFEQLQLLSIIFAQVPCTLGPSNYIAVREGIARGNWMPYALTEAVNWTYKWLHRALELVPRGGRGLGSQVNQWTGELVRLVSG